MNLLILALGGLLVYNTYKQCSITKKGKDGEKIIQKHLKKLEKETKGIAINNIILKNGNSYCQIDHVFVTDNSIIVIETKNHSGWVYGDNETRYFTVCYGKKKYSLYSPIVQNQRHIEVLAKMLKLDKSVFKNLVVFSNDKSVIDKPINNVCNIHEFDTQLKKMCNGKGKVDKKHIVASIKSMNVSNVRKEVRNQVKFAKKYKKL